MNLKDLPFGLKIARRAFLKSDYKKHRCGAAYIEGAKIISACNSRKTSPLSVSLDSHWGFQHSEMNVFKNLPDGSCSKGTLFIWRQKASGAPGLSRPCHSCEKLIRSKGIRKLIRSEEH